MCWWLLSLSEPPNSSPDGLPRRSLGLRPRSRGHPPAEEGLDMGGVRAVPLHREGGGEEDQAELGGRERVESASAALRTGLVGSRGSAMPRGHDRGRGRLGAPGPGARRRSNTFLPPPPYESRGGVRCLVRSGPPRPPNRRGGGLRDVPQAVRMGPQQSGIPRRRGQGLIAFRPAPLVALLETGDPSRRARIRTYPWRPAPD